MTSVTRVRKMHQIILALLEQSTNQKAAAALGISEVTLWRWMQKPEFQPAYHEVLQEQIRRRAAKLLQASGAAVATICKVMMDPNTPQTVRVRAADCVLQHTAKTLAMHEQGKQGQRDHGETTHTPIPVIIMPTAD